MTNRIEKPNPDLLADGFGITGEDERLAFLCGFEDGVDQGYPLTYHQQYTSKVQQACYDLGAAIAAIHARLVEELSS